VLAAVSGRSAAGTPDHGCPRCFFPRQKLHPVKFVLTVGGGHTRGAHKRARLIGGMHLKQIGVNRDNAAAPDVAGNVFKVDVNGAI